MTAFESLDHQYVIKFFNPRETVEKKWFSRFKKIAPLCSLKWIFNAYFKKTERINSLMDFYQTGFNELKEEAALVYVHLSASTVLDKKLHVVDKSGTEREIDLKSSPFVLQRKGDLVLGELNRLLKEGKTEVLKKRFVQLYDLFSSRAQKGFSDPFQMLEKNYVFIEARAVQIDLGRMERDLGLNAEEEVQKIFSRLETRYP